MEKSMVKRVGALAKKLPAKVFRDARAKLEHITRGIAFGTDFSGQLLGIEQVAKSAIDNRLKTLREEQANLRRLVAIGERQYRRLSYEPLKWRDENGWPCLAVYSLESADCTIECSRSFITSPIRFGSDRYRFDFSLPTHLLPSHLRECYRDMEDLLKAECVRKHSRAAALSITIKLSSRFVGIIPSDVKEKIRDAQSIFGENIFLIAEARWTKTATQPPPAIDRDPLVVGWDGADLWLIDVFDITPVEQAMINPHFSA